MSVDLIVAHFGTSRDPGVKRLHQSSERPSLQWPFKACPPHGHRQCRCRFGTVEGGRKWDGLRKDGSISPEKEEQAKLGNSSVSPNVGHLVLKYLCPAIRDVLSDGLKAYVLDVIVGQRRNVPWSIVEASTQLGRGLPGPPEITLSFSRPGRAPSSLPALASPRLHGMRA
ncbi:Iporin, partial [Ophiophagus hannah]